MNCQKHNAKFEIEILQMENTDFVYLIKFKRISGAEKEYHEITCDIINNLET